MLINIINVVWISQCLYVFMLFVCAVLFVFQTCSQLRALHLARSGVAQILVGWFCSDSPHVI